MAHFKKSYITTTLGIIIILGAVVTVFMKLASWLEAGAAITIGTGFLFTKDASLNRNP